MTDTLATHPQCTEVGSHDAHAVYGEQCPGREVPDPPVTLEDHLRRMYDRKRRFRHIATKAVNTDSPYDMAQKAVKIAEYTAAMDVIEDVLDTYKEAQQ